MNKRLILVLFTMLMGCAGKSHQSFSTNIASETHKPCNKTEKAKVNLIGFSIGMNKCEVPGYAEYGEFDDYSGKVRLHGIKVKPMFDFDTNDKVEAVYIQIGPRRFEDLKEAYRKKYPELKCQSSKVQNRFGAQFENETCTVTGKDEILIISKYAENINNGVVLLKSLKSYEESKNRRKKYYDEI
ncbi:hypothetical protein [Methylotuvimicrobium sp. KM2]|uniref:hypothetical protein n=1 Tax=Methylotuvimicrobium sp. KM2 TaxID=3133976 RepID=UPI003100DF35